MYELEKGTFFENKIVNQKSDQIVVCPIKTREIFSLSPSRAVGRSEIFLGGHTITSSDSRSKFLGGHIVLL